MAIRPVTPSAAGFGALAADDAVAEGHRFVARLAEEWRSGANRSDRPGEALLGVSSGGVLMAVGGLNADPYLPDGAGTGRLRHVYARPAWRRAGLGALLTRRLVSLAAPRFRRVRLRTGDPGAARLYVRRGFEPVAEPDATHALVVAR